MFLFLVRASKLFRTLKLPIRLLFYSLVSISSCFFFGLSVEISPHLCSSMNNRGMALMSTLVDAASPVIISAVSRLDIVCSIFEPSSRLYSATPLRMSIHRHMPPDFLCALSSHGTCRYYALKHPPWYCVEFDMSFFCKIGS